MSERGNDGVATGVSAISIIMPCYNRAHDLAAVLQAYDTQTTPEPFELIAVDDASTDATYEILCDYRPTHYVLRPVRQAENQGPAAARNRAIAMVQSPLVAFVGDDILPDPDFVAGHLVAHRSSPGSGSAFLGRVTWAQHLPCNTLMTHIDGKGAQQFSYYFLRDGQEYDYRHFYTCNVSVKRDLLWSLDHWFDTDFPYAAFEDAELAFRLAGLGMHLTYRSDLHAQHTHYHTIWSFSRRQYHCGLMAWIFTRKHPSVAPLVLRSNFRRVVELAWQTRLGPAISVADELESLALHLASYYEWMPHRLLDGFYIQLLDYFYVKGLQEAFYARTRLSDRARSAFAHRTLIPILRSFVWAALESDIPLPEGYDVGTLPRLTTIFQK